MVRTHNGITGSYNKERASASYSNMELSTVYIGKKQGTESVEYIIIRAKEGKRLCVFLLVQSEMSGKVPKELVTFVPLVQGSGHWGARVTGFSL